MQYIAPSRTTPLTSSQSRVGHLGERLVRPDRGVVDQDVDAPELGQRPRHHRLDLILLGDVGDNGERLDPELPGLARDGVGLGLVAAGVDDDVRAFAGQLQHRRTADIAPRPGDQRDLPIELTHQRPPLTMFKTYRVPASYRVGHVG